MPTKIPQTSVAPAAPPRPPSPAPPPRGPRAPPRRGPPPARARARLRRERVSAARSEDSDYRVGGEYESFARINTATRQFNGMTTIRLPVAQINDQEYSSGIPHLEIGKLFGSDSDHEPDNRGKRRWKVLKSGADKFATATPDTPFSLSARCMTIHMTNL